MFGAWLWPRFILRPALSLPMSPSASGSLALRNTINTRSALRNVINSIWWPIWSLSSHLYPFIEIVWACISHCMRLRFGWWIWSSMKFIPQWWDGITQVWTRCPMRWLLSAMHESRCHGAYEISIDFDWFPDKTRIHGNEFAEVSSFLRHHGSHTKWFDMWPFWNVLISFLQGIQARSSIPRVKHPQAFLWIEEQVREAHAPGQDHSS